MRITFIGGGTMAGAIISGLLSKNVASTGDITIGEPSEKRRTLLSGQYGIVATSNNIEAIAKAEIVVLSVKPQMLPDVLKQMHGHLIDSQTILSIVAGTKINTIQKLLNNVPTIRVMPNTPSQISEGISVWTCSGNVSADVRKFAKSMLEGIGKEIYVPDETYIDMATALSASGPAYVFTFIEALVAGGQSVGLPKDMALTLALQTVLGSVKLVKEANKDPSDLRNMVATPGGTTVEGIKVLDEFGFQQIIINAIRAAHKKSLELGKDDD